MHDQTGLTPQPGRHERRLSLASLFGGGRALRARKTAARRTTEAAAPRGAFTEPLEGRVMFDVSTPVQLTVQPNVNATQLLENQHSPAVAINRADAGNVFIASTFDNRGSGALDDRDIDEDQVPDPSILGASPVGIVGSSSHDAGVTFANSGLFPGGVTPSATYDEFGNLFVAYYVPEVPAFTGSFEETGTVHIALSTDEGVTFTELKQYSVTIVDLNNNAFFTDLDPATINDTLDTPQPTIVTGHGQVWVAFENEEFLPSSDVATPTLLGNQIVAAGAVVHGLGAVDTFTDTETAFRSEGGQSPDIAIGPKGQVMVSYEVPRIDPDAVTVPLVDGDQFVVFTQTITGPSDIFVNVDPDGLGPIPFGKRSKVTDTKVGLSEPLPASPDRVANAEAGIVYDRSGGPFNGRAWMVYTDERQTRGSNDTEILLRFSDDDGVTWSGARRVSTDPDTRTSQFLPRIALDQTNGNIAISWYDARQSQDASFGPNDEVKYMGVVGRPTTAEAGVAFTDNVVLSTGITDVSRTRSLVGLGYYTGLDFDNNVLYASFADNSNSTNNNPSGGVATGQALATLDIYSTRVIVTAQPLDIPAVTPVGPGSPLKPQFVGRDTISKGKFYKFQVRYESANGIDVSTLGDDDLLITGPSGYNLFADFTKAKASKRGTVVTATYVAQAPGGLFDSGDNGLYSILVQGGSVKDLTGTATTAGLLDQFLVSSTLAPQSPAEHAAVVSASDERDKLAAVGL